MRFGYANGVFSFHLATFPFLVSLVDQVCRLTLGGDIFDGRFNKYFLI